MAEALKNEILDEGKLTWGQLLEKARAAGIKEGDEIDRISISWGSAKEVKIERDEDFGWQISLGIDL